MNEKIKAIVVNDKMIGPNGIPYEIGHELELNRVQFEVFSRVGNVELAPEKKADKPAKNTAPKTEKIVTNPQK